VETQATILVVDPDESERASLRETLALAGYTVHQSSIPDDVVAEASRVRPHLIILGRSLAGAEDAAACRAIRAEGCLASTPVLIMTSAQSDAAVLAGLNAGADDYVFYDSAPPLILARVRRLIDFRKMAGLAMLDRQLVQVGRLLAGIIHEIRGPLSVIRGSAELLRSSLQERPEDLQWVESILRGSSLLQLRLEHLMGAVRTGPVQMEPIDVAALLTETVDLFVRGLPPHPRRVAVQADCTESFRVRGDAGRLMQVFLDLLTNAYQAITASGREGRVTVKTDCVREDGRDWVKLSIRDDGPGVPDAYLRRIFEPFFTTREGGSGYGLYLAAEIVRELGGRLAAENNPEGGACFSILLPLDAVARAPESA